MYTSLYNVAFYIFVHFIFRMFLVFRIQHLCKEKVHIWISAPLASLSSALCQRRAMLSLCTAKVAQCYSYAILTVRTDKAAQC